ncbi:MAG TPA: response regulator [Stellaceae bacterium]
MSASRAGKTAGAVNVLVVEDDPELRELAADFLEFLGYRTMVAASGDAALAILKAERGIDLIFTDLVMPGKLDGLALAEKARRLDPAVKIVFTSGYVGHAALRQRLPAPDEVFVHKPYRSRDLAAAIERALSG